MRRTQKAVRELVDHLNERLNNRSVGYRIRVDGAYGRARLMREVTGMPQINMWLTGRMPAGEAYEFVNGMHSMLDVLD